MTRIEIQDELIRIGVKPSLKGFHYLVDAIERYDPKKAIYAGLYQEIAELHNDTISRVERVIRHAIDVCFDHNSRALYDLFGGTNDPERGKPSNSEFIALLRLRMEQKEKPSRNGNSEKGR